MQKVKFLEDASATFSTGVEIVYKRDQVVELNDASAGHWLKKGLCVVQDAKGPRKPPATKRVTKKKAGKKAASKKATNKGE